MSIELAVRTEGLAGSGATLMGLIRGTSGSIVTQSDIDSIAYTVVDHNGTSIATGSLTVSTVIFDTLQTPAIWTADSTGYNFRHDTPASWFTNAGTYTITYTFTPASGEVFKARGQRSVRS